MHFCIHMSPISRPPTTHSCITSGLIAIFLHCSNGSINISLTAEEIYEQTQAASLCHWMGCINKWQNGPYIFTACVGLNSWTESSSYCIFHPTEWYKWMFSNFLSLIFQDKLTKRSFECSLECYWRKKWNSIYTFTNSHLELHWCEKEWGDFLCSDIIPFVFCLDIRESVSSLAYRNTQVENKYVTSCTHNQSLGPL